MKWCILQQSTPLVILEGHEMRPFVNLLKKMGIPRLFDIAGAGGALLVLGLMGGSSVLLLGGTNISRWLPLLLAATGLLLLSVLAAVESSVECSDRWPKP
jgi:hypothetical protein